MLNKKVFAGMLVAVVALVASVDAQSYTFTRSLSQGARGADVMNLQKALNMCADTQVAASGIGSAGMETSFFGPATKAAVIKWQAKVGVNPIGIFGPASRAAFAAKGNVCGGTTSTLPAGCVPGAMFSSTTGLSCSTTTPSLPAGCTSTAGFSSTTGAKCDGSTGGTPSTGFNVSMNGSRGSIDSVTLGSRADVEALEGEQNVEIYAVDIKTRNDGPLMVQAADIWFSQTSATTTVSDRPWDYFSKVSLMAGGQVLATVDASSASVWGDDVNTEITAANSDREYRLRFNGLNVVLPSNTTSKLSVAVSMVNNLDSADEAAVWYVEHGVVRIMDESGLVQNADPRPTATALEQSFVVAAADEAVLEIRDAANKVDATLVAVSETADTNGVNIYNFNLRERGGVAATVTELSATFTTDSTVGAQNGDNEGSVIKRAYLYDGSTKLGEETVTAGGAVIFDNMNISLAKDATKTLSVVVDLFDTNDGARYEEGTTVTVAVLGTGYEATDANGNDESEITLSSTTSANVHELRSEGIKVALVGSPTATVTAVDAANNDLVQFNWVADITAFGSEDVFINSDPADVVASSDAADVDTLYAVQVASGAALTALSGTISSSETPVAGGAGTWNSVATYNGENFIRVAAGSTVRVTISVSGANQTDSKQVRALLNGIEWTKDTVTSGAANTPAATINSYTFNLGVKAATPYVVVN